MGFTYPTISSDTQFMQNGTRKTVPGSGGQGNIIAGILTESVSGGVVRADENTVAGDCGGYVTRVYGAIGTADPYTAPRAGYFATNTACLVDIVPIASGMVFDIPADGEIIGVGGIVESDFSDNGGPGVYAPVINGTDNLDLAFEGNNTYPVQTIDASAASLTAGTLLLEVLGPTTQPGNTGSKRSYRCRVR